mgnify:CR=1 FL=1
MYKRPLPPPAACRLGRALLDADGDDTEPEDDDDELRHMPEHEPAVEDVAAPAATAQPVAPESKRKQAVEPAQLPAGPPPIPPAAPSAIAQPASQSQAEPQHLPQPPLQPQPQPQLPSNVGPAHVASYAPAPFASPAAAHPAGQPVAVAAASLKSPAASVGPVARVAAPSALPASVLGHAVAAPFAGSDEPDAEPVVDAAPFVAAVAAPSSTALPAKSPVPPPAPLPPVSASPASPGPTALPSLEAALLQLIRSGALGQQHTDSTLSVPQSASSSTALALLEDEKNHEIVGFYPPLYPLAAGSPTARPPE